MLSERISLLADGALRAVFPENIYCICCGDVMDGSRASGLCDACAENLLKAEKKLIPVNGAVLSALTYIRDTDPKPQRLCCLLLPY